MATQKLEKIIVDAGQGKDFSFLGFKMGDSRDFHNKQMTNWSHYTVYRRTSGYICTIRDEAITKTSILSEGRMLKAKSKAEVMAFFGLSDAAKELYQKIGIKPIKL